MRDNVGKTTLNMELPARTKGGSLLRRFMAVVKEDTQKAGVTEEG